MRTISHLFVGAFISAMFFAGLFLGTMRSHLEPGDFANLFLGIVAIISALATVLALNKQIQQTWHIRDDDIRRSALAANAMLPTLLSERAIQSRAIIAQICGPSPSYREDWSAFLTNIEHFKMCIQFGAARPSEILAKVLMIEQILIARSSGVLSGIPPSVVSDDEDCFSFGSTLHSRSALLFGWIRYYSLIEATFDYSRGRSTTIPEHEIPWKSNVLLFLEDSDGLELQPETKLRFERYTKARLNGKQAFALNDIRVGK